MTTYTPEQRKEALELNKTVKLTQGEFDALPEYTCSNPTGTVIGKRWKRATKDGWFLCEYVGCNEPGYIDITKKHIAILTEMKEVDELQDSAFTPKTELASRLWEIRKRIIASGEPLLDWDGVQKEAEE